MRHNGEWMRTNVKYKLSFRDEIASSSQVGRPSLPYDALSERSQRRKASSTSAFTGHNPKHLVQAASHAAYKARETDLAMILREATTPTRPKKMKEKLLSPNVGRLSADEGLSTLLDLSLSLEQYREIRRILLSQGANVFPPYSAIQRAKAKLRPETRLELSETSASFKLETILVTTVDRILELQQVVFEQYFTGTVANVCYLYCSWGFDGTTGLSEYKQRFSSEHSSDEYLFATTLIPLRILSEDKRTVLWNNRTPQSVRFCRPVKLQFAKETKELVLSEKNRMEQEILSLSNHFVYVNNQKVLVKFVLNLTLIDGKILSIITGTSTQSCPICKAPPSSFNDERNLGSEIFLPEPGALKHGVSPLHAWIRLFECVLHIGYKIVEKKWQVREQNAKQRVLLRKITIQKEFKQHLGLNVDKPKAGGAGISNDGNTARAAFENARVFSQITGVDESLINQMHHILIALSCQLPLDHLAFGNYCRNTFSLYISLYAWYPMPATLHKILVHSEEIILNSVLPVGMLGESASESLNKYYKKFRLYHARKSGRLENLSDMFYRVWDMSDPVVSSISLSKRTQKKKNVPLPDEVKDLLLEIEPVSFSDDYFEEEGMDSSGYPETALNLESIQLSDEEEV